MKLAVSLAVLGLVAIGHALECYYCKSEKAISGAPTMGGDAEVCPKENFPKKECPDGSKSCVKYTDTKNSSIVALGCATEDKSDCTKDKLKCYCKTNHCNGSERGWPSAVLLLAALAAALVGGR